MTGDKKTCQTPKIWESILVNTQAKAKKWDSRTNRDKAFEKWGKDRERWGIGISANGASGLHENLRGAACKSGSVEQVRGGVGRYFLGSVHKLRKRGKASTGMFRM